jgi:Holliday junction DNA helicase RuvA
LVAVPGVGKKSADRILLELQDKLGFAMGGSSARAPGSEAKVLGPVSQQVVEGLTRLGFKPSEAEWAVSSLGKSVEDQSIGEVIREALALLRH